MQYMVEAPCYYSESRANMFHAFVQCVDNHLQVSHLFQVGSMRERRGHMLNMCGLAAPYGASVSSIAVFSALFEKRRSFCHNRPGAPQTGASHLQWASRGRWLPLAYPLQQRGAPM